MTDECFEGIRLPALRPPHGLRSQTNLLARRGLDLVATSTDRLAEAPRELALARHCLDMAERQLNDRTAWSIFAVHSRDAYRHGLRAMAIHLQVNQGDGPVECANNLLRQARLVPFCTTGFSDILPNTVDFFERVVALITSDRPQDAADAAIVADASWWTVREWPVFFAHQKLFVADVSEVVERPQMRARSDGCVDVLFPYVGEALTEGTIVRWFKTPGQAVDHGEDLLEVATDTIWEVPSPVAGVLTAIVVKEGERVHPFSVVGIVRPDLDKR